MKVVFVGFACNNACVFCAQGELRKTAPAHDWRASVDEIENGDEVAIAGGEPTIRDDLAAIVSAIHARNPARIVLQTNGRRFAYAAYARAIEAASDLLSLDLSLHGSTAAMHDYHTSVPDSFRQTMVGLKNARSARVTTVVARSNFRHLAEIADVARAAGAIAIRFVLAEPFGSAARSADRVIPAPELAKPLIAVAETEAKRIGLEVGGPGFAPIGEVERVAPAKRIALPVVGRPVPARNEERGVTKRTGRELEAIFPALFEEGKD